MKPASAMTSGRRGVDAPPRARCSKSAADMPGARSTVAVVGAQVARAGQSGRLGAVGNDDARHAALMLTGEAGARDRGHVDAAAGDEDGEPEAACRRSFVDDDAARRRRVPHR